MEVKVAGKQFQRAASRQANDIKRALKGRTKVKVSTLLSPESQQAMLMVRQETFPDRPTRQEKPATPRMAPRMKSSVVVRPSDGSPCSSDYLSQRHHMGFGALLDRVCTARLHGDITDINSTPKLSRKRALRSGDRLHTAMEVVEIVRHDDDDDNKPYDDTDDEEEAIHRAALFISQQRCQAWLELHFDPDNDDTNSVSSAER